MKRAFQLLLAAIFLIVATFGNGFLDNFKQNDYNLTSEWSEVVRFDALYVKHLSVTPMKYNRTTFVTNVSWEYKIDLDYGLEIVVQAYKFLSNEYRVVPGMRCQINICEAIEKDIAGLKASLKCGNFTGCPLKKNRHEYVCSFQPDQTHLPPLMPVGRYMMEYHAMYKSKELHVTRDYVKITHSV